MPYDVEIRNTWSPQTHPDAFPNEAHFSWVGGATHSSAVTFWALGGLASPGMVEMAENGATFELEAEVNTAIQLGSANHFIKQRHWFCPALKEGQELPAAQALLASGQINLINATVTADALHCQRQTAHEIVTRGGDYVIRLEDNQPGLRRRAESLLEDLRKEPPLFRPAPRKTTGASKSATSTPAK